MSIQIVSVLEGRGLVRAVFEVDYAGLRLRGLKLQSSGALGMPSRKIQDRWQQLYDVRDPQLREELLRRLEQAC